MILLNRSYWPQAAPQPRKAAVENASLITSGREAPESLPALVERLLRERNINVHFATVAACGVAALIDIALRTVLPDTPMFMLFVPVVVAAALLGGFWPGMLATVLGLLVAMSLSPHAVATPWVFTAICIASTLGGDWAYRARRRGEEAARVLAEREAHLRSIFDSAPDAMIVIDERGVIQTYSAAAQRMFGWTAAEILGRNVSMLMPQPYKAEHDAYLHRYLDTGEKRIIGIGRIVVGERKDGSVFPLELAVGELHSTRGRYFTGFVRDLTERQEAEDRLQELQAELVHISRVSAMGEMASSLAHELNQPLSAVANYMNGARRLLEQAGGGDKRVIDAIAKAGEQALRAGDIIRRLRDFLSRGEGERTIEPLSKLVQEACALALVGARDQAVRVQYRLAAMPMMALVDRVQIQQVILNFVRNAMDAMEGQPRRELIVATERAENDMALVSVIDTGPGLDPNVADRLFQPFVTSKPHGMGVGLSISRTIVEAHGGRIWTEPNPGGGAIFHFTVPLATSEAETHA